LGESIAEFLQGYHIPREVIVFLVSMLPIVELRGGIPIASFLGMPWYMAMPICIAGNILPVPFIILFVRRVFDFLRRFKPFRRMIEWLERKAHTKGSSIREKRLMGMLVALFVFVAIPLPGTGAWTGAMIAATLDLRMRYALPAILLGVVCAGLIMMTLAFVLPSLFGTMLGGAAPV